MMNKECKQTRIIYYHDELHDDFGEVGLSRPPVPANYCYLRRFRLLSWITYYLFAKPIMGLACKFQGVKVVGKKNLKKVRKTGYFLYSNHVSLIDAFKFPAFVIPTQRVNIIGYSDTLSIKGVKGFAKAVGYLPIPNDLNNLRKMKDAIKTLVDKKEIVLIYPEAHIWPYYTHIRNFQSVSFSYPAEFNKPVLPAVTVWRGKPNKKPKQTVVIGEPIYPNPELSVSENKKYLHEQCLYQMKLISSSYEQAEYIKYIKKDN